MSDRAAERGPGVRLLGFLAALVVVFAVGLGLGVLFGPGDAPADPAHAPATHAPTASGHP